jgi:hypothetical protein
MRANMGRFVTATDPQGNEFGLWQNDPRPRADRLKPADKRVAPPAAHPRPIPRTREISYEPSLTHPLASWRLATERVPTRPDGGSVHRAAHAPHPQVVKAAASVLGLSGDRTTSVPAANVPASFLVKGSDRREFTRDAASFIRDYVHRAPNALGMTGGQRIDVCVQDADTRPHADRAVSVQLSGEGLVIRALAPAETKPRQRLRQRRPFKWSRNALTEPPRGSRIRWPTAFFFDNPNFRPRRGRRFR